MVSSRCGDVVARISDGETGDRQLWIVAQIAVLSRVAGLELVRRERGPHDDWLPDEGLIWLRLRDGVAPGDLEFPPLGYADAASRSYAGFSELQAEGVIPVGVRFQVSLPTPLAITNAYIAPDNQAAVEPQIESAMRRELRDIQQAIPAERLAIQWDVAVEITNIEGVFPVYFSPVIDGVVERLGRIAQWVEPEVPLGFHLCYGDAGGKHVIEPRDMSVLADLATRISSGVPRRVDWIHMPVPIERDDDAYFAPLASLRLQPETMLYLGLLHKEDGLEGARRRIETARRVVERFGVATECGLARDAEREEIPRILDLHREAVQLL